MTFRNITQSPADYEYSFELVVNERDKKGNPTGKKKVMRTNDPSKLDAFWEYNQPRKHHKKDKKQESTTTEKKDKK